jgi:hypothetical protein
VRHTFLGEHRRHRTAEDRDDEVALPTLPERRALIEEPPLGDLEPAGTPLRGRVLRIEDVAEVGMERPVGRVRDLARVRRRVAAASQGRPLSGEPLLREPLARRHQEPHERDALGDAPGDGKAQGCEHEASETGARHGHQSLCIVAARLTSPATNG